MSIKKIKPDAGLYFFYTHQDKTLKTLGFRSPARVGPKYPTGVICEAYRGLNHLGFQSPARVGPKYPSGVICEAYRGLDYNIAVNSFILLRALKRR